ncbi:MAG TPA: hypothetical protein PLI05_01875 [Methanotrichaceae archaeon]|nr:hypothetical protein [Methanotrichaceae archaeon]HQF15801.1 hypothetical protein [Methanotrichaceae archaeon]HQI90523.1 hypothetical protein [Methanotrichaceae archaeon]HQJ28088.1 hypothetical protein [Methanotrichaceae archaeon]
MIHTDRVYSSKELDSEDELVQAVTKHTWPLCYSFYHDGLLYLNDTDSESDPEYVVMIFDRAEGHHDVIGREVGRFRPRDMDEAAVRKYVADMEAGRWETELPLRVVAEPVWHHSCACCRLIEEE